MSLTKALGILPSPALQNFARTSVAFASPDFVRNVYKFPRGNTANKHWNPDFKKLRGAKIIKFELPDFHKKEDPAEMTPEEIRSWRKERGLQPVRPWQEKSFAPTTLAEVIEEYVPPEGDGKLSPLNSAGAQQKYEWLKKKTTSWKELRTIRKFEEDFELYPEFTDKAQETYIKAHECLAANDEKNLIKYTTEKAYPLMLFNSKGKTIRWKFIKSLEPPRVCHIRTAEMFSKDNRFGQITVRFHTQQTLAIYDRFGRLMHGSETVAKDVLEYVVFEKHLSSFYGTWRIHHKIIPDWLPELGSSPRTYVLKEGEEDLGTAKEARAERQKAVFEVPL